MHIQYVKQQEYTSKSTSRNQIPKLFKQVKWKPFSTNGDIGGGKYDSGTMYLKSLQVNNILYDPFNRTYEENSVALHNMLGQCDTVTVSNVLNVIKEPENRELVIKLAYDSLKPNGVGYFSIYEGDKSNIGKPSLFGWQNNLKTDIYLCEICNHFNNYSIKKNIITVEK